MSIEILTDKCVGCKLCVKACPFGAISMEGKLAVIDFDKCTLCGACVEACKFDAILLRREEEKTEDTADFKGVWVVAEQKKGVIQSVTYELLGKGRELADKLDSELAVVLIRIPPKPPEFRYLYPSCLLRLIQTSSTPLPFDVLGRA